MNAIYGARCYKCGDLSMLPAEKESHINIAKSHNEATGHTCEVYEETKSVFVNRREIEIISNNDKHAIATFS